MEWNDIYDIDRNFTGRKHLRGTPWGEGEYGLAVCVWVYDGLGKILLTRRAPEKSYAGTWENSGGAAQAGENSRRAVARELLEETGIRAQENEFEYLCSSLDEHFHYDHYCLKRNVPLEEIVLQTGETDAVQWADFAKIHRMVESGEICDIIGNQFLRMEKMLLDRQTVQE